MTVRRKKPGKVVRISRRPTRSVRAAESWDLLANAQQVWIWTWSA